MNPTVPSKGHRYQRWATSVVAVALIAVLYFYFLCDTADLSASGSCGGHEYVDLGLPSGLNWATCNVGASKPTDCGDSYAWGEAHTKHRHTERNSRTSARAGNGSISGSSELDAARANWGGTWRMPTKAEIDELIENCDYKWVLRGLVSGAQFTSKTNGKSIFIPAHVKHVYGRRDSKYECKIWSATPEDGDSAYLLGCGPSWHCVYSWLRNDAAMVRPVTE